MKELYPRTGHARIIGVTGNPGSGKSTLADCLITELRRRHERVGVVAVDPTSPFSGGAILGDRIRMQRHFEDTGVFIRSIATRGALGGLSRSAMDVVRVLDAWGAAVVLLETVGVGQDELDVTRAAHSTVVVMAPGLGDDIQAIKAGIVECADVFAVNKADYPSADVAVRDLENMLALASLSLSAIAPTSGHHGASNLLKRGHDVSTTDWTVPVIKTIATRNEGVDALLDKLDEHFRWLTQTDAGRQRNAQRQRDQLSHYLRDTLTEAAVSTLGAQVDEMARRVEDREIDPYTACEQLIEAFRSNTGGLPR